jgi:subtilisin family serine protease
MAGTIAGRMNNRVGVAGVAPNSKLLPLLITRVEHGNLMRLSSIAAAIERAADAGSHIINVSAKWPVDSRAVSEAIARATSGRRGVERLLVTGYATSFDAADRVIEGYPSRYRCLPGVLAAVPGDLRDDTMDPAGGTADNPSDGRIMAPGVDIVVTTTDNPNSKYALVESAGSSSAAAYVSGAAALVWGSRPLDRCGAADIKRVMFCRSKSSATAKYPWINVEFLNEVARLPSDASCADAIAALGCNP